MGRARRWLAVLAVGALAVAGCGDEPPAAAPTLDPQAVAAAEDVILATTQTMFTWYPTKDASPGDGYQRAAPALRRDVRPAFDAVTDGALMSWPRWRSQKLTLTATSRLGDGLSESAGDRVERAVIVTQTGMLPTGAVEATYEFVIDRIVASVSKGDWRIVDINFSSANPYHAATCPPGQEHRPAPDGPCQPVQAPRICPDGSSAPNGQPCPPPRTGPQTKNCADGTTVPVNAACPDQGTAVTTKTCPDGSSVPTDRECPGVGPEPCPEGQTRTADGQCTGNTTVDCSDGTEVAEGETCPATQCPDGTTVADGQPCTPVTCSDGSTVPNGQTCPSKSCPDGQSVPDGQTCPAKQCPDGSTVPNGGTCPAKVFPPPTPAACTGPEGGFCVPTCTGGRIESGGWCYVPGDPALPGSGGGAGPRSWTADEGGATSLGYRVTRMSNHAGRSLAAHRGSPRTDRLGA